MNTFALVIVFPDLGEARLPDKRIPHFVSLKYHQEEVTREDRKGHKRVLFSHLFPSSEVSQHRNCKAEREPAKENPVRTVERECVAIKVRSRKIKMNFQTVLMVEDERGKDAGKELICVTKGIKDNERSLHLRGFWSF